MNKKKSELAHLTSLLVQALNHHKNNDLTSAMSLYKKVLAMDEKNFDALNLCATLLLQVRNYSGALELFLRAIKINPNNSICFNNQGICLKNLKKYNESLSSYDRAIALNPLYEEAFFNRANLFAQLRKHKQALKDYDEALKLRPKYLEAILNKANTLGELNRHEEAIKNYEKVLDIESDHEKARIGLSQSFRCMRNFKQAFEHLQRINLQRSSVSGMAALGDFYRETGEFHLSIVSYENAIELDPNHSGAWFGKGMALSKLQRYSESINCYKRAKDLDLDCEYELIDQLILMDQMMIAQWADYESNRIKVIKSLNQRTNTIPFLFLLISDDPNTHFKEAEKYVEKNTTHDLSDEIKIYTHSKIRIGYFSADFNTHPVALLLSELFKVHNRELFEIVGFCLKKPKADDPIYEKLVDTFDYFIDLEETSNQQASQIAKDLEIDIAVDLGGHTDGGRTGLFATRVAPIQVNYFGYPSTIGAKYMDYIIADHVVVSNENQIFFSEKIAFMPNSYMVDDSSRVASNTNFSRASFDLPENKFLFCCFNNSYKFNRTILEVWVKILLNAPNSILWLSENNIEFKENILLEFSKAGIRSDRIFFAKRLESMADHLARYQLADLFLDTHPYNAHTTALDALKMGVPVLTYCGQTFAGRVAASLLTCLGLEELIASSLDEYISKALELYSSPEQMKRIKAKLAENLKTKPLFDTQSYVNHLEVLYLEMYRRYLSGLPPETFSFQDIKFA